MVRMKDVAKHAGVSPATVSNVVTGKQYVSDDVREAVENSIEKLGYKVNLVARGLKSKRTFTVGVILPDITKMFFPDVLRGIEAGANANNYKIICLSSNFNFDTERQHVDYLKASCVDGIIIDSCCHRDKQKQWAHELARGGSGENRFSVVSIEQDLDEQKVSSVLVDFKELSYVAAKHLIDLRREHIVYIKGREGLSHTYERFLGYKAALENHGINYREELVFESDFSSFTAYNAIARTVKDKIRFDAVQCVNDQTAIGALKALLEAGIKVPEQVAITGFDNIFPSTLVSPQITTIDIPRYEIGRQAFRELNRLMGDEEAKPACTILEGHLVVRNSTLVDSQGDWDLSLW